MSLSPILRSWVETLDPDTYGDVQFFESITFELIDKQVALLALPALPPTPQRLGKCMTQHMKTLHLYTILFPFAGIYV